MQPQTLPKPRTQPTKTGNRRTNSQTQR